MTHPHFEGPEKKVEVAVVDGFAPLRSLGGAFWESVVRAAGADVLSIAQNDYCDAYLLSESSLFVYDGYVTMITCGRTTLVSAVTRMLDRIDRDAVAVLIYERKSEHFPHEQPTSFFDDARCLRELLPGRALRFGVEHEHAVRMFHTTRDHMPSADDRTLEVLMHGIDPTAAARFTEEASPRALDLGLEKILEGYKIDEHVFAPAGYSFNALRGAAYTTLHVTPQRTGSYVSFETNDNAIGHDPSVFVTELVRLFRPEAFDIVVFEPDADPVTLAIEGYIPRKHVSEPVSGYQVTFQHFYRPSPAIARAFPISLD